MSRPIYASAPPPPATAPPPAAGLPHAAAAAVEEEVVVVDYEKLATELESASPLEIVDEALKRFGGDIAIAFRLESPSSLPLLLTLGFFGLRRGMGRLKLSPFIYTYSDIEISAFNWERIRFNVSAKSLA